MLKLLLETWLGKDRVWGHMQSRQQCDDPSAVK